MSSKLKRDSEGLWRPHSCGGIYGGHSSERVVPRNVGEGDLPARARGILHSTPNNSTSQLFFESWQVRARYSDTTATTIDLDATLTLPNLHSCTNMAPDQATPQSNSGSEEVIRTQTSPDSTHSAPYTQITTVLEDLPGEPARKSKRNRTEVYTKS
ncbi:unnamed protein product [Phytophthora fragariaefolia]|uniref:Unnamed protein product n=1 Tax=Phytophthora fragariaefolia TaxID=1490495 RepID=A0A9W6YCS1_9STRA|nr:unnamed protein product [Phytophthora fragariaefolia]